MSPRRHRDKDDDHGLQHRHRDKDDDHRRQHRYRVNNKRSGRHNKKHSRRHNKKHPRRHRGDDDGRSKKRTQHSSGSRDSQRRRRHLKPSNRNSTGRSAPETDIARLANTLADIVKSGSKESHDFMNEKFLPEFDPAERNISAAEWLDKVNTCGIMYDWDDKTKFYLAVCKLRGNAKLWYGGLAGTILTWETFAVAIVRQFPGEVSFGELLKDAANYSSSPGQDLQAYCFVKMGKLNRLKLDLSEAQIADSVAQGIHDEGIRRIVLAASCKTLP